MRVLVTGSAGLVGSQVARDLVGAGHEVYSGYNAARPGCGNPTRLDLADPGCIRGAVSRAAPDAVIHLAAMTDVDGCESQPGLAMRINAGATGDVAREAARLGAFFLYVSTDYVFDGTRGMRAEGDSTNPLGRYGESKLAGEAAAAASAPGWAVARTSTPFGPHPARKPFPAWVREGLEAGREVPALVDQFTSPTFVPNLSRMLIEIATRRIAGTIHAAGATRISRYGLAEMVAERLGLDGGLLRPARMEQMGWAARRPSDSSLDVSRAARILREKPMRAEESLDLFLAGG